MKIYHVADLFTLLEAILAVVLFGMAVGNISPDYALWIFAIGEICDAVDGACARRWHYPNDGKYRWWRVHNEGIDQITDIMLAFACGIYLIWRVNNVIGVLLLGGIGMFCLYVQGTALYYNPHSNKFELTGNPTAKALLLFRRLLYVIVGVGGAVLTLIWHTSYPRVIKIVLTVILMIVGIFLFIKKSNRRTQYRTPL